MKNRRNLITMLLLATVFLTPGLAAYVFYQHTDWLGAAKTNKGVLLNPPIALAILNKAPKWKLVFWNPGICENACQQELDKLARVRLALGRRLYEVQIDFLMNLDASQLSGVLTDRLHKADINLIPIPGNKRQELTVLPSHSQTFIANPNNFLVLAYQSSAKPDDIFHDIKRLLTVKE